jgi:phosphoribosylanthranilate isomerase
MTHDWQIFAGNAELSRLAPRRSLLAENMNPLIKICGLSTPETVAAALDNGADMVGFIFFPKSPRHVSVEQASGLRVAATGRAKAVAVTVDAPDAVLDEIVAGMKPDMLQLHGHETPERVAAVKARFGLPVMKAISIRERSDLDQIAPFIGIADKFLLDAKAPKGSELPGGNGVSFDWALLSALDPSLDYMLSGGLNADNVAAALAMTNAPGLDISSGVESAPGVKDIALIDKFFAAVAAAGEIK